MKLSETFHRARSSGWIGFLCLNVIIVAATPRVAQADRCVDCMVGGDQASSQNTVRLSSRRSSALLIERGHSPLDVKGPANNRSPVAKRRHALSKSCALRTPSSASPRHYGPVKTPPSSSSQIHRFPDGDINAQTVLADDHDKAALRIVDRWLSCPTQQNPRSTHHATLKQNPRKQRKNTWLAAHRIDDSGRYSAVTGGVLLSKRGMLALRLTRRLFQSRRQTACNNRCGVSRRFAWLPSSAVSFDCRRNENFQKQKRHRLLAGTILASS
ncbi:MAG: hypothetical protein R3A47_01770 [Polyangiales bacterium]